MGVHTPSQLFIQIICNWLIYIYPFTTQIEICYPYAYMPVMETGGRRKSEKFVEKSAL